MALNYTPANKIPMSSSTNKNAANYRVPASSYSNAKNAAGNTIYAGAPQPAKQNGGWYGNERYWAPGQAPQGEVAGASTSNGDGGGGGEPDWGSMIAEMYDPYKKELNDMEGSVNSEHAADEKVLTDQFALNEQQANDQGTELIGDANREEGKFMSTLGSAYEESIRDFNNLLQQGQVRFGRGSSAGRAVGELAQREFFRNSGKINEKKAEGAEEFSRERLKIGTYVKDKLSQFKIDKDAAMNNLKANLRERLSQVRMQKYDVEQNKINDRMAVLQDTISQARQMNQVDKTFRQNLGTAAISKMQEVQGKAFTPKEIQAVMAEFGINLNLGAGSYQQGNSPMVGRSGGKDELASLQGGGYLG